MKPDGAHMPFLKGDSSEEVSVYYCQKDGGSNFSGTLIVQANPKLCIFIIKLSTFMSRNNSICLCKR